MVLGAWGDYYLAIRFLMLSYFFDVIDGWLARRYGGSTPEGLMLDRAFDRVSQVIAPLVVYTGWARSSGALESEVSLALFTIYAAGLVAVAFWRLVRRIVWSLQYFAGLPMFVHSGVLLLPVIAGTPIHPAVLLALLLASGLPVPYLRRLKPSSPTPSPATPLRLAVVAGLALIPYHLHPIKVAAKLLLLALLAYAVTGPIPPLVWRARLEPPRSAETRSSGPAGL